MFTEKFDFQGGGEEFTKNRYRGGNCLKRGRLGQFVDSGEGGGRVERKRGVLFLKEG